MPEVRKYKYQGREITVPEAAKLAGVSDQTIYNRLKANGGDIELAILGGGNRMMKLPDIDPTEKKVQELAEILTSKQPPAPAGNDQLARLNNLIRALGGVYEIGLAGETVERIDEIRTELIDRRCLMYGHLVDWDELARR